MDETDISKVLGPHLASVKIPGSGDKVFKDECVFSFDSPVSYGSILLIHK